MTESEAAPPERQISPWWRPKLTEVASRAAAQGDLDPDDATLAVLAECDVTELAHVKQVVSDLRRAVGQVAHFVDRLIAADVKTYGPIRLGDSLYTTTFSSSRKVLPGMGERLFDYLGGDLRKCVNPGNVKITGLRAIAETRGDDAKAVEDTFYERTLTTEPELAVVPVGQRKWAQRLKDGERGHP